jgi:signal peptidase II
MRDRLSVRLSAWLALAALIIVLDQISKFAILKTLPLHAGWEITGFFNLVHVRNEGAAFSFLADQAGWQRYFFITLGALISALIVYWLKKPAPTAYKGALALILGGAIGNVIDRIVHGNVIDFIDLHAAGWHWPAFNVADSAITVGAVLILLSSFKHHD